MIQKGRVAHVKRGCGVGLDHSQPVCENIAVKPRNPPENLAIREVTTFHHANKFIVTFPYTFLFLHSYDHSIYTISAIITFEFLLFSHFYSLFNIVKISNIYKNRKRSTVNSHVSTSPGFKNCQHVG